MPEWWWYLRVVLILIGYFHSPSRTKDHVRSWTQKVISISAGEYFFSVFTNSQYCHHTKGLNNDQFFLPNGVTPANQFDDYNKLGSCSALFIVSYHLQYTLEFGHSLACPESQIFFSLSFIWQSTSHLVASGIHWSPLVSFRGVPRTSVALNVRQWYAQLCKWFDNISIDLSPEDRSAVDASMKKDLLATEPHKVMKLNPEKANACISAAYTFVLSTRYWTQIQILLILLTLRYWRIQPDQNLARERYLQPLALKTQTSFASQGLGDVRKALGILGDPVASVNSCQTSVLPLVWAFFSVSFSANWLAVAVFLRSG